MRSGDNLWSIAQQHKVTAADLQRWNRLKGHSLKAGQILTLHLAGTTGQTSSGNTRHSVTYYKVRRGDSLAAIAERFSVDIRHLKEWNPSLGRGSNRGRC